MGFYGKNLGIEKSTQVSIQAPRSGTFRDHRGLSASFLVTAEYESSVATPAEKVSWLASRLVTAFFSARSSRGANLWANTNAVTDAKVVFDEAQAQYGQYVNTAWIPVGGTRRRPSTLNLP